MDWKLATMVVMNGWPATRARTLRSLRTCSTCLRRMTGQGGLALGWARPRVCVGGEARLTVDLAQDLEGKHLVLVAVLGVLYAHQPDARKGT